jgi:hypothetical protein
VDGHEFDLHFHRQRFDNECLRRTGTAFQSFFEDIMSRAEPTFMIVKPWGSDGDRKCDGLINATGTLFQVYAPEQIKVTQTKLKIETDFAGAVDGWPDMRSWIFVWSALNEGLPPELVLCLQKIQNNHPALEITNWGSEQLWKVVAEQLDNEQRASLLGPVPRVESANATTAVEIQTVLNFLAEQPIGPEPDNSFDLTDLRPKLEKNRLSPEIESLAGRALPLAREVERYVNGSYDGQLSSRVGSRLIARYRELTTMGVTGDQAFIDLIDFSAGDRGRPEQFFWGAAGIVTYYFQICDIFER